MSGPRRHSAGAGRRQIPGISGGTKTTAYSSAETPKLILWLKVL